MRLSSISKFNTANSYAFYKKNQSIKQNNGLSFEKAYKDTSAPKKPSLFIRFKNWLSKELVWKDSLEYDLKVEQEKFNSEIKRAKAKQDSDIEEFEEQ